MIEYKQVADAIEACRKAKEADLYAEFSLARAREHSNQAHAAYAAAYATFQRLAKEYSESASNVDLPNSIEFGKLSR